MIDSEFKKALETLALSHDTQKKAVSIRFAGEGKRHVKVGYVDREPHLEDELSARAGDEEGEAVPARLGGGGEPDRRGLEGRPHGPGQRPAHLLPDGPVLAPLRAPSRRRSRTLRVPQSRRLQRQHGGRPTTDGDAASRARMAAASTPAKRQLRGSALGRRAGQAWRGSGGIADGSAKRDASKPRTSGDSVSSAATAAKLGDFFQYAIDKPVSLPRQKSALLPIVGKDVQASRLSIYNERTQAKFPLLGLKFKNSSGLHLMQGPITVFEGSTYAGDARILDLQPNEERLISYAIDLGVEVNPVPSFENGRILSLKAVKGIIHTTVKNRQVKTYQIKNRNEQERLVLIEHPVNNAFHLDRRQAQGDRQRLLPLRGQGSRRRHQDPGRRRGTGGAEQLHPEQQQRRSDSLVPVAADRQQEGPGRPETGHGSALGDGEDHARDRRDAAATEHDHGGSDAHPRQPEGDAEHVEGRTRRTWTSSRCRRSRSRPTRPTSRSCKAVEHSQKKEFDDYLANFSAE